MHHGSGFAPADTAPSPFSFVPHPPISLLALLLQLMDRFLQDNVVVRNRLQLVGVTAMMIASKYEEIYPPEMRDFVYICDNAYTKQQILDMEQLMLEKLKVPCSPPPPRTPA
jgi:hypothetical protein